MPTLTIDFTAAQAARMQEAFKAKTGMQTDPTIADLKAYLVAHVRSIVHKYESQVAANTQVPWEPS